jgi:hypothetical protein
MTENMIVHLGEAVDAGGDLGFMARYQAPCLGVRYVRDARGVIILYGEKVKAERAAWRALGLALDQRQPPRSAKAKVFRVLGSGKGRKAVEVT